MINRISMADLQKKIKFFLRYKIPYRLELTNERRVLHAQGRWGSWMNRESSFKPSELSFIKSVKASIIKNKTYELVREKYKKGIASKRIKYFRYNKAFTAGDYFEDVTEYDLKNAYWYKTFSLNLVDEQLYQKGLTVSKKSRLAAIGSLAREKKVVEFDGKVEHDRPPIISRKTRFLWNVISYEIGKVMQEASLAAGDDFIFFWVDAIFVKGKGAAKIEKLLKKSGFQFTSTKCEWVRFENNKITVKCTAPSKVKTITKNVESVVVRDGKKYIRTQKVKEKRDERPFPYKAAISDVDLMELSSNQ